MPTKSKSYTLYTLHVPVLFLILALTLVVSYAMRPQEESKVATLSYAMVHEEQVLGSNTSVISEGGKTAEVTKEVVGDKVVIRMKIFDSEGNLIREKVTEKPVKPTHQKSEDTMQRQEKPEVVQRQQINQNAQEQRVTEQRIQQQQAQERANESTETPRRKEIPANTFSRFPIRVNEETGEFYIQTRGKMVELGIMPDAIAEKAVSTGSVDEVATVRIDTNETEEPVIILEGNVQRNVLRMFPVRVNVEEMYDVETGERASYKFPTVRDRILNFLSF